MFGGIGTQGGAEYRLPWAMICQPYRLKFTTPGAQKNVTIIDIVLNAYPKMP